MIKIHKELYVIINDTYEVQDSDFKMSYMTYVESDKEGKPKQSFLKRKQTGLDWARSKEGITFDNKPMNNLKVVGSVSRWSTSNKLIRIEDPRGFVVEIPTGNLTTLLKHTTVEKGVVKEACVWGREGSNHILLPTNSAEYKGAVEDNKLDNSKVSFAKLKTNDIIKFSVDDTIEYIYLGRAKATWEVQTRESHSKTTNYWRNDRYRRLEEDPVTNNIEVTDSKNCFIFKMASEPTHSWLSTYEYKSSGKCIVVVSTEKTTKVLTITIKGVALDLPERCQPEGYNRYSDNWSSNHVSTWYSKTTKHITVQEVI